VNGRQIKGNVQKRNLKKKQTLQEESRLAMYMRSVCATTVAVEGQ
jgi:hypothetical protein